MGHPATHRGVLALLLLVVAASPASWAQQHVPEVAQETQEVEFPVEELLASLREVLDQYETLAFPGIPTINIVSGDQVSIAISLSDLYLEGLNNVKPSLDPGLAERRAALQLDWKKISLLVGSYTSSGHILNLPFNGEGPMYLRLHDLLVTVSVNYTIQVIPSGVCAVANTSDYDLDLIRMETHLENLNKGTDQGQLVDLVVPSFGQDIVERLEVLIKSKYYDFLDKTLVGLINYVACPTKPEGDVLKTDELMSVMKDIVKDFLPTLQDF